MSAMPNESDGRVTLAVLSNDIRHLTGKVDAVLEDHEQRLRSAEAFCSTTAEWVRGHHDEHAELRLKGRVESAIAAVVAGVMAYLAPRP